MWTVSTSIAQPLTGTFAAVHAAAETDVGVDVPGSPPPPTCARLVTVTPVASALSTATATLNALLPPTGIDVPLLQRKLVRPDAMQLQFAPFAPPGVNGVLPV